MTRALIVYASRHGGSAGIADRIGQTLEAAGLEVLVRDASKKPDPVSFDACVIAILVVMATAIAVTLATVFLILLIMLRGIVVAGLLLASVVLSYASAVGLGVLVWQILLDRPLDWWVPVNAFVLLVAVGADYNMLLMKRVREEATDGSPLGIARAVSATGRVITAAGLIFAASMFAMMFGSITSLAQLGFTVGMGLLLDTVIVSTRVVPAAAALLGPRLWWPGHRVDRDGRSVAADAELSGARV